MTSRPSLLQRALGVFIGFALLLALLLWASGNFVHRRVQNQYLDRQRLAALQSFERAIVPARSLRGYQTPTADILRKQFDFCLEGLPKPSPGAVAARGRGNACANADPAEELACQLGAINLRLAEMSGDARFNRERLLNERYVVSVERWVEGIRGQSGERSEAKLPMSAGKSRTASLQAVSAPATASEAREPVSCRSALGAARDLASGDARLLGLFAWRERSPRNLVASKFAPGQEVLISERLLEQRNPWGGVPGCIYYGDAGAVGGKLLFISDSRQSNRPACLAMRPAAVAESALQPVSANARGDDTPPVSLDVILADLDNVRLPWKELFRAYTEAPPPPAKSSTEPQVQFPEAQLTSASSSVEANNAPPTARVAVPHGPNQLERAKHKIDAGFNVHLTIDPRAQSIVQQVASCYAGDAAVCSRVDLSHDSQFNELLKLMYEKAAVRMAAVALIDIPSGRIEALGSAHTDCYRQEFDGPGRNAECPELPSTPHYEPDRLLNHALYTDALPGSTIKPIMATGFLRDPQYRSRILSERVAGDFLRIQDELKSSDSAAFLNRMFCADKGWKNCGRPRDVQQAALLYHWDEGCAEASFRCGRLNVLFGYPDVTRVRDDTARLPLGASVMYGRLLTEPVAAARPADFQMMHNFSFDAGAAAACSGGAFYTGAGNRAWRKCHKGHLTFLESEGWGQGNARTTALGAAGMVARLAAAANGQPTQRLPYLVDRISDAQAQPFQLAAQQFRLADPVTIEIPQQDAALILDGMLSHKSAGVPRGTRSGTAHVSCGRVFGTPVCDRIDWIAGKTGTPPYGNDGITLKDMRQKCRIGQNSGPSLDDDWLTACSRERPYKWYVAAFRTGDKVAGFNKAIAVLTERNWYRYGPQAGKVQSPGDTDGLNLSAEIAFRIMERLRTDPIVPPATNGGKS